MRIVEIMAKARKLARAKAELDVAAEAAHRERLQMLADWARRIPDAQGRERAATALLKLESDPGAILGIVELLACAGTPTARRP